MKTSRLEGFYKKSVDERLKLVQEQTGLTDEEAAALKGGALPLDTADRMVENVVGLYPLPVGIATNFKVNGKEVLVPMVLEEPSVIAAASNGARLCLPTGFKAETDEPIMRGQVQIVGVKDAAAAVKEINKHSKELIAKANEKDSTLVKLGGGAKKVEARVLKGSRGDMVLVEIWVNVQDAMGANAVNTMCEAIAGETEKITGGKRRARILTNLAIERKARASCVWKKEELGEETIEAILDAYDLAAHDPFRATTHNKGIMNGIDALMIATGNDWRAIEAGAHAWAWYGNGGTHLPLTRYEKTKGGDLKGSIELPLAIGIVGGATRTHPLAKIGLKILGIKSSREVGEIAASLGLAQNFAALRALSTVGIQSGHMKLHARQIAIAAGAAGKEADRIAEQMVAEKNIRVERARELLGSKG